MKKQVNLKLCLFVLIMSAFFLFTTTVFIGSTHTNMGQPENTSVAHMISYIDSKRSNAEGSVFCINQDRIYYFENFLDEERDYDIPFSQHFQNNSALSEQQKKVNPVNLRLLFQHNPNVYDNPVSASPLSDHWYDVQIQWNSEKSKWELLDGASSVLFHIPTDDKRGEWKITLSGTDDTGKPLFDKESKNIALFRVHKAPIPKFIFTENGTTATLKDNGSYDIDYQYSKNSRRNAAGDRQYSGIKEFYWSAKIGDSWVDVGRGPSVTFSKNGKEVTDYRLTVEDYDGATATVSASALPVEKPLADFYFMAGKQATQYFYTGNRGHETASVTPSIGWNDEMFSKPPYITSGVRTEKWTALATGDSRSTVSSFNTDVLKGKYNQVVRNQHLEVKLEAKNKFDYVGNVKKTAEIVPLAVEDKTGSEIAAVCQECYIAIGPKKPFLVGTTARFILENSESKVHFDDLKVVVNAPAAGISNQEMKLDGSRFVYDWKLQNPSAYNKTWWDSFDYTFKLYSKRTGEYLHEVPGRVFIHTPITVKGQINGSDKQQEINTDEPISVTAKTEKYAETVSVKFPVAVIVNGKEIPPGTLIPLTPDNSHTSWTGSIIISGDTIEEDTKIKADFEAIAYNKRDKGTDSVEMQVVAYRLENLRITQVRDFQLEDYYKGPDGRFQDVEMNVNQMAVDKDSFTPFPVDGLAKGYLFEFKIDSINFNDDADTIIITPSYYAVNGSVRDNTAKYGYWIDSNKKVWRMGQGGHSGYAQIRLTKENRTAAEENKAIWNGRFMIPGTAFLSSSGDVKNALEQKADGDIIVAFHVVGYKNGVPKYDYNLKQWPKERETAKKPYQIGDVIRYDGKRSNLDDLKVMRVRP